MTASKGGGKKGGYGPTKGADRPIPVRLEPPPFLRFARGELNACWSLVGHPMALQLYSFLVEGSVWKGSRAGEFLGTYDGLRARLMPPRPEKGQWALPPTVKQLRTVLDAMERAGLIARDAERNRMQGQLRIRLLHRSESTVTPFESKGRR